MRIQEDNLLQPETMLTKICIIKLLIPHFLLSLEIQKPNAPPVLRTSNQFSRSKTNGQKLNAQRKTRCP